MLKYGIIVTAGHMSAWQLAVVEHLHQSKLAQLHCVVNDTSGLHSPRCFPSQVYADVALLEPVEAGAVASIEPHAVQYDIPLAKPDGWQLTAGWFGVDFFLLFGDARSAAPLLQAAPYGVWQFAHSDLKEFSTSAPGFWEVSGDRDVTGAFLLRLHDGGAGVPLKSGYMPTLRHSFEENVESVLRTTVKWPLHVCWDITHGAADYFDAPPLPLPATHYGNPSGIQIVRMRLMEQRARAAVYLRDNFSSIEWTVARVRERPQDFIGGDRRADVSYVYSPGNARYFADPCVVTHGSDTYLFCEEYRRETKSGTVSVSQLDTFGASPPRTAIEEPHHLSYPHVFEHEGQTYCIPESGRIRKVCLYRSVEFPHKWEYAHTLIDGFEAADSTVLRYGDRWWLFCTSSEAAPRGYYSHLYIWHATDLLGSWTPHVRNPVKIDARSARPAGQIFAHEGLLYRPAQDCSRSYGRAVLINRIDKLSPYDFEETVVGTIRPPRHGYTRGLHTLSAAGNWCVVDVERYAFNPDRARYTITQTIKRALLRAGIPEDGIAWIKRKIRGVEATEMRTPQPSKVE